MYNDKRPLISVLIPVYNAEKFLVACLNGVLAQTYENFEVVCANNGSEDESPRILEEYARKDARIKVIQCGKNQGIAWVRNMLLESATGEYIAFVDADDRILPDYLNRLLETALKRQADVVRCLYYFLDERDGSQTPCEARCKEFLHVNPGNTPVQRLQTALDDSQVWLKLIKTSLIKENQIRFAPGVLTEDIGFEILLYQHAKNPVFIQDHLYLYRVANPNSLSSNKAISAYGTLQAMVWLCGEFPRRHFTGAALYAKLIGLTLQAVRRMRKYTLPEEYPVSKTCRAAFEAIRHIRSYCGYVQRMKYQMYGWLAGYMKDESLSRFACWFR